MEADKTTLPVLLERIKAATGPSFALEQEIERVLEPDRTEMGLLTLRYSASLDAALALCERILPGWSWWVGNADTPEDDPHGRRATPRAILKRGETTSLSVYEKRWFDGHASSPALAVLAALVGAEMEKNDA